MNTEPDGFLGAIMAAEGVRGMKAVINGPGGCRSRTQILLKELVREYYPEDARCCSSRYFSRQSKLPCTYLNSKDVVCGSADKIAEGIRSISSVSDSNLVLINTLGASVQVTDEKGIIDRSEHPERTMLASRYLSTMSFQEGFDDTIRRMAEHIGSYGGDVVQGNVNVLGYNYSDSGWEFGKKELESLIIAAGAKKVSFIGCDCTIEDMKRAGVAELNILIHPECSAKTAEFYRKEYGTSCLIPSHGSPIGYGSIISFIGEVSEFFGVDPSLTVGRIIADRKEVDRIIMNSEKSAGSLRGCGISLSGIPSDVLPIAEWMHAHLSMVPAHIRTVCESHHSKPLRCFLESIDCTEALDSERFQDCIVIFADGMTAERMKAECTDAVCVQTLMPYSYRTSLINRSIVGIGGCRYILDEILNGLGAFHCGQPTMVDFR